MKMNNTRLSGISADAVLLTLIKLLTTALGLTTTRLLAEHLSIHDYGTYSQILLIVSTVASFTIFGMMDGMNYFYCREGDLKKREAYTATIFVSQLVLGTIVGIVVMLLSAPLCAYFDNADIKGLLVFAATLPVLQNLLWILQVLIVAVGEARSLALRNFIVSVVRLAIVIWMISAVKNVVLFLAVTVLLDVAQLLFFGVILRKSGCYIRLSKVEFRLLGEILKYCAPMAMFIMVNSLNRDIDKYFVSIMTDTETLAIYANASKQLPFDIILSSFGTVLVSHVIKHFSENNKKEATRLCKLYLEIAYISTGVFCFAALSAAPQLMNLLYSNKYSAGLSIFCVYILIDFLRVTNLTIILSSAGKTKLLMLLGMGTLIVNVLMNFLLFNIMGLIGPAVATLVVTILAGVIMLYYDAKVLDVRISGLFNLKYLCVFILENLILTFAWRYVGVVMENNGVHYFLILTIIAGSYVMVMLLLNGKRLLANMKYLNSVSEK